MLMCSLRKAPDVSKREEAPYLIQYSPGPGWENEIYINGIPQQAHDELPCLEHSGSKEAFPGHVCCVHTALLVRSRLCVESRAGGHSAARCPLRYVVVLEF